MAFETVKTIRTVKCFHTQMLVTEGLFVHGSSLTNTSISINRHFKHTHTVSTCRESLNRTALGHLCNKNKLTKIKKTNLLFNFCSIILLRKLLVYKFCKISVVIGNIKFVENVYE